MAAGQGIDSKADGCIRPDWAAPASVCAMVSTRQAPGVSLSPYDRCNLGDHVGDDPAAVQRNRDLLRGALALPGEPLWLQQVHGKEVFAASKLLSQPMSPPVADAAFTARSGQVLAVLTADCLPLLVCADDGSEVAAIHAGWRGLASGVIEATLQRMQTPASRLLIWLGPAIGPTAFEVGTEVRDVFVAHDRDAAIAFRPHTRGADKHWCDIYRLARQRLALLGVGRVSGGDLCSVSDPKRFYSHRRDRITGRMASLIWIRPA